MPLFCTVKDLDHGSGALSICSVPPVALFNVRETEVAEPVTSYLTLRELSWAGLSSLLQAEREKRIMEMKRIIFLFL